MDAIGRGAAPFAFIRISQVSRDASSSLGNWSVPGSSIILNNNSNILKLLIDYCT